MIYLFAVYSSILCIPVWSIDGERVFSLSRIHQSKHLPAAVSLPGMSLREQLFVHGLGSLCVPLLQTWGPHRLPVTGLGMWWAPLRSFHVPVALVLSKVWPGQLMCVQVWCASEVCCTTPVFHHAAGLAELCLAQKRVTLTTVRRGVAVQTAATMMMYASAASNCKTLSVLVTYYSVWCN